MLKYYLVDSIKKNSYRKSKFVRPANPYSSRCEILFDFRYLKEKGKYKEKLFCLIYRFDMGL